jgi:hypothetical protein
MKEIIWGTGDAEENGEKCSPRIGILNVANIEQDC